jgi:hypothetical protein
MEEIFVRFKYVRRSVTNQNCIHREVKSKLNLRNGCYHLVWNILPSHLLSVNLRIKIYKTIILSVVLYGCDNRSLTLREEHTLRVLESRVLRIIFGAKMVTQW